VRKFGECVDQLLDECRVYNLRHSYFGNGLFSLISAFRYAERYRLAGITQVPILAVMKSLCVAGLMIAHHCWLGDVVSIEKPPHSTEAAFLLRRALVASDQEVEGWSAVAQSETNSGNSMHPRLTRASC